MFASAFLISGTSATYSVNETVSSVSIVISSVERILSDSSAADVPNGFCDIGSQAVSSTKVISIAAVLNFFMIVFLTPYSVNPVFFGIK